MATENLSAFSSENLPDASNMRVGIVVSEWNAQVTENLLRGALDTLTGQGVRLDNVHVVHVPGSFELAVGATLMIANRSVEAVICLGSIIRGETPHFEFVSLATANGIMEVGLKTGRPVIFGVLTDDTMDQALARSGGNKGNKGVEAAVTAIKMIALRRQLEDNLI
ncbi:MAG: 6,7-dimethyl-8-ribityllumazine synthase [Flavobacteriales bacterium]|jgi:6,7-dimethyl-8-ribityllumazine synthase